MLLCSEQSSDQHGARRYEYVYTNLTTYGTVPIRHTREEPSHASFSPRQLWHRVATLGSWVSRTLTLNLIALRSLSLLSLQEETSVRSPAGKYQSRSHLRKESSPRDSVTYQLD